LAAKKSILYASSRELADLIGVTTRTISRWSKHPDFPTPIFIGGCKRPRWLREQVEAYLRRGGRASGDT
jgi:predicted DNA-binding transcriptional regulator AlpA